jgi:FkbM family methyltransferase
VNISLIFAGMFALAIVLITVLLTVKLTLYFQKIRQLRSAIPASKLESPIEMGRPYQLVKAREGWLLANPNDFYLGRAIFEYGEFVEFESQFLLGLLSIRPGRVIEVGANSGLHTISLAKALAPERREIVAFEPQPFVFQNLCANLALNGLTNAIAYPWACGAKTETVYFPRINYELQNNSGATSMTPEARPGDVAVSCVRLDDVVGTAPVSLLKIDVEGYELLTLQGAIETITRSRPLMYVENDRVDKSQALIEWLWSQNYRLFWHLPPLFNPDNFFKNEVNIYGPIVSINMLCLPDEVKVNTGEMQEICSATYHPLNQPTSKHSA